jgi:bifunctional DNase/RNase
VESSQPVLRADIYNLQGQLVRTVKGDIHSVSVSDLSAGVYTVKLATEQGVTVKKFVKQ